MFSQLRTMMATLVAYSNSQFKYTNDTNLANLTGFIIDKTESSIEAMRIIQSQMNFVDFDLS